MPTQRFLLLATVDIAFHETQTPLTNDDAVEYLDGLLLSFADEVTPVRLQAFALAADPHEPRQER